MNRRAVGKEKEEQAADYLRAHGYEILSANYCSRRGEADLIAREGGYLVFVEVKYRKDAGFGYPGEAVDLRKQKALVYTARRYLFCCGLPEDTPVRFDVVAILGSYIFLYQNSFEISGED